MVGISELSADLDLLKSFDGLSTIVCVFVTLCIVVIDPCLMPSDSCTTLTIGAKQFVVQEAAVTILCMFGS